MQPQLLQNIFFLITQGLSNPKGSNILNSDERMERLVKSLTSDGARTFNGKYNLSVDGFQLIPKVEEDSLTIKLSFQFMVVESNILGKLVLNFLRLKQPFRRAAVTA